MNVDDTAHVTLEVVGEASNAIKIKGGVDLDEISLSGFLVG